MTLGLEVLLSLRERAPGLKAPDSSSGHPGRWLERALDLRTVLLAAEAVVRGALAREESRGAHHREDFLKESDAWRKNLLCAADEGGEMHLWTEPVPELPEGIQKALDEDYSLDYHYLE